MCYYLYGAINDGIHMADYEKLDHTDYEFPTGSEEDVIKSINKEDCKYRITHTHCDCGTPIGDGHENKKGLKEAADYFKSLQEVRGMKHVYLCKVWAGDQVEKQQTVHIQDVDILHFLAHVEDCCLYKIELYKKYW